MDYNSYVYLFEKKDDYYSLLGFIKGYYDEDRKIIIDLHGNSYRHVLLDDNIGFAMRRSKEYIENNNITPDTSFLDNSKVLFENVNGILKITSIDNKSVHAIDYDARNIMIEKTK